jgi:transposase-like protein
MPITTVIAEPIPACPRCHAAHVVRNGKTKAGSPNFLCRGCNRRFVAEPKRAPITEDRRELVRRLLLERLSLRAIARASGVSRTWLQGFVNHLYREQTPWEPGPLKKSRAG